MRGVLIKRALYFAFGGMFICLVLGAHLSSGALVSPGSAALGGAANGLIWWITSVVAVAGWKISRCGYRFSGRLLAVGIVAASVLTTVLFLRSSLAGSGANGVPLWLAVALFICYAGALFLAMHCFTHCKVPGRHYVICDGRIYIEGMTFAVMGFTGLNGLRLRPLGSHRLERTLLSIDNDGDAADRECDAVLDVSVNANAAEKRMPAVDVSEAWELIAERVRSRLREVLEERGERRAFTTVPPESFGEVVVRIKYLSITISMRDAAEVADVKKERTY